MKTIRHTAFARIFRIFMKGIHVTVFSLGASLVCKANSDGIKKNFVFNQKKIGHIGLTSLSVFLFLLTFIQPFKTNAEYPQDAFISPLDIPLKVSGTFGELRSNHFHSGIDFRTQQREGLPVFSVADGYVSRVSVSPVGFGKAVYISHPNGYTSVYAHLLDFYPELEDFVRREQYRQKSFNVNLYLESGRFLVQQGNQIGRSGNTGSSMGPHLHFEIRETGSQMPINPLLFGFDVKDNIHPTMQSVGIFPLGLERFAQNPEYYSLRPDKGGVYKLNQDTLITNFQKTGFGLQVFDRLTGSPNQNGVYKLKLYVNDTLAYYHRTSTFAFAETRYLNAHIDYAGRIKHNRFMHRLHLLPNNRFSMYEKIRKNGLVRFQEDETKHIRLEAADFHGNVSSTTFFLQYKKPENPFVFELGENVYTFPFGKKNTISAPELKLEFPANAFYDTVLFKYHWTPSLKPGIHSAIHNLHNPTVPVHQFFDISIKLHDLPEMLKPKAYLAYEDFNGNTAYRSASLTKDGWLKGRSRELGKFYALLDTVPPMVEPLNLHANKNMRNEKEIRVRIRDRESGIKDYTPTINGEWILMEYDAKNDLLTYTFREDFPEGEHAFKLIVTDNVNNQNSIEIKFRR